MDWSNKIKEVVVVEGYHDLALLKSISNDMDVVITNGSEVSEDTLKELKALNETRGLILFLDPDYQGERIRRLINDYVGTTKHAFLPQSQCISKNKRKVGIEHATKEDIISALSVVITSTKSTNNTWNIQDLYDFNLIGQKESKQLRTILCEQFGIGYANGKSLVKKLNMFDINKKQVEEFIKGVING